MGVAIVVRRVPDPTARARVAEAEQNAWLDLLGSLGPTLSGGEAAEIGLPPPATLPCLLHGLQKSLAIAHA